MLGMMAPRYLKPGDVVITDQGTGVVIDAYAYRREVRTVNGQRQNDSVYWYEDDYGTDACDEPRYAIEHRSQGKYAWFCNDEIQDVVSLGPFH